MQVEYYLVSAARRAHRLRTDRVYVFGREPTVDIPLQDALVSRRHAEVRWQEESKGWDLVDLDSRNGVMLNGVRIKGSGRLEDGDQVQIGGQVYCYHLLPPGGDPASLGNAAPQISNVETMGPGLSLSELATRGAAFTGVLSDGLLALLQFLSQTNKTGRLDLLGPMPMTSVWVKQGAPVHATAGDKSGSAALLALAVSPPPRFAFHSEALSDVTTITGPAQAVLMDVARRMDEEQRS